MRRISPQGRRKSPRALAPQVVSLESRLLLSADVLPASSAGYAVPQSIGRMLTPAEVSAIPSGSSASTPAATGPNSPAQIRHAYGVDQLSEDGTGQTIGIVDAYDQTASDVGSELATFDTRFNLPAANLSVVVPSGTNPTLNAGWDLEIALDVEWAHVIAPAAKIVLVEAATASDSSLLAGVNTAVSLGANQVSMSWGGGEFGTESLDNSYFNHPGVTFLAAAGDTGSEVLFPAVSPYVTSVGGTYVTLDSGGNKTSEAAWTSGGGGPSTQLAQPSFQAGFSTGSPNRATPDVAYNADPNSGVYVALGNTVNGSFSLSYNQVGGTSAGAPQWAGLVALANQGRVANGQPTLGTGQAFGTNSVLYQLAGGTSYTNPNGDFLDITAGSNGHAATTGYDQATGLGSPVANQLIPDLIGPGQTAGTPTVGDAGFESVAVGSLGYQYNPTGSAWSFAGYAGVSANNSGFTSGNPAAPQGSQVAFLQMTGSLSQSVAGWGAGNYTIAFDAAQRGNNGASNEDFQVTVDGKVVGTFKPTSTSYQAFTTNAFTVTAGAHVVKFLGLDSVGGDNTAFLDAVSVALATSPPPTPTVGDAGFEAVAVGAGNFQYDASGSAWAFAGNAGVSANNSGFTAGNLAAPQGSQVAFLQTTGGITQSVANWAAGNYTISFDAAQRSYFGASNEDFQVTVDGKVVGTFKPTTTTYQLYTTGSFAVTAGAHTIGFLGLDSVGGDNTAFLDAVSIATA